MQSETFEIRKRTVEYNKLESRVITLQLNYRLLFDFFLCVSSWLLGRLAGISMKREAS